MTARTLLGVTVMVALHSQLSQAGTQKSSQPHPLADIPCKTRPRAWRPTDAAHPWPSCGHVRPALGREVAPRCCAARTCGGAGGGGACILLPFPLVRPSNACSARAFLPGRAVVGSSRCSSLPSERRALYLVFAARCEAACRTSCAEDRGEGGGLGRPQRMPGSCPGAPLPCVPGEPT